MMVMHVLTSNQVPSKYRVHEFRTHNLGKYGPDNQLLKGLAAKGLVRITGNKVTATKKGKQSFDAKEALRIFNEH